MKKPLLLVAIVTGTFLAGCTSFKTTALYRFENDSVVGECNNQKLKGLPVKLKVPSHVRVTIYESQVMVAKVKKDDPNTKYSLVSFNPAQVTVKTDLEYTDKVFLVDFRRPAGGVLDLTSVKMDEEQYFADVQASITERTMADVSTALNTLKEPLSQPKKNAAKPTDSTTDETEANSNVTFQESILATQRFDISEADWECRMQQFIDEQLYAIKENLDK